MSILSNDTNFYIFADAFARHLNMSVFPLVPKSKKPITKNGFKDASKDPSVISSWWKEHPDANIGCATGRPSGIVVLDFDAKPDADVIVKEFEEKFSKLPSTPKVKSGGGGYHFYFKTNVYLPCRVKIIHGVDFRGDSGYIVLPPSIHENGRLYNWEPGYHVNDLPIAEIPGWLIDLVTKSQNLTSSSGSSGNAYFKDITENGVEEGCRTVTLTSVIGHLLAKRVDLNLAKELVLSLNEMKFKPPLSQDVVFKTLDSIAGRELKKRLKKGPK